MVPVGSGIGLASVFAVYRLVVEGRSFAEGVATSSAESMVKAVAALAADTAVMEIVNSVGVAGTLAADSAGRYHPGGGAEMALAGFGLAASILT